MEKSNCVLIKNNSNCPCFCVAKNNGKKKKQTANLQNKYSECFYGPVCLFCILLSRVKQRAEVSDLRLSLSFAAAAAAALAAARAAVVAARLSLRSVLFSPFVGSC